MPIDSDASPPGHTRQRARIALAHDWLCGMRGGEFVLDAIARLVTESHEPDALYAMFADGRAMSPAIDAWPRTISWLNGLPLASGRGRRWLLPLYPLAAAHLSRVLAAEHQRRPIDLVISTSSAAIKSLCAPRGVPHVCYCHSPARYLWSQTDEYAKTSSLVGLGLAVCGPMLRRWDARTASRVTTFVANSTHTAREIERCYGRSSIVIHPPVRTDYFTPDASASREDFWLAVGALEPYKRFDLAIDAARRAGARLVVIGSGTMRESLIRRSGGHVEFRGRVSDERLRDAYRRARVLIFPQIEDFGIVAVEAQACGCPVVARRAGGAVEIVRDGVTGALVEEASPEAFAGAASAAGGYSAKACRANAERFSEAAFREAMQTVIAEAIDRRGASTT